LKERKEEDRYYCKMDFIDYFILLCLVNAFLNLFDKNEDYENEIEINEGFSNDFYEKEKPTKKMNILKKRKRIRYKVQFTAPMLVKTTRSGKIYNRL
jgi:hypothetical protein